MRYSLSTVLLVTLTPQVRAATYRNPIIVGKWPDPGIIRLKKRKKTEKPPRSSETFSLDFHQRRPIMKAVYAGRLLKAGKAKEEPLESRPRG
jgi:hypothetical protein